MSRDDNYCQCMSLADQGGGGATARDKPPLTSQSNFLHFHEVFGGKIGQNNGLTFDVGAPAIDFLRNIRWQNYRD